MGRHDPGLGSRSAFRVDWVLVNELALGPAPRSPDHLDQLQAEGVKAICSLCSEVEAPMPAGQSERFRCERLVLPDHRSGRLPDHDDLLAALGSLKRLRQAGPVYVHCVAAIERSPLLCLAWLVSCHGQTPQRALDYLMQMHPGTNPLPGQLRLLERLTQQGEPQD